MACAARRRGIRARQDQAAADETGNHFVLRLAVQLARLAELHHPARLHHRNAAGKGHGLGLVMGDVDHAGAGAAVKVEELALHGSAQMHVEIGQRLVQQHHGRVGRKAAGQSNALALAAGQIRRGAAAKSLHAHGCQRLAAAARPLRRADTGHLQRIADIFLHAHVRPQGVVLEDDADVALFRRHTCGRGGHLAPAKPDGAGVQRLEARDQPQHRRLAAAGGAENGDELPVVDRQGHPVHHPLAAIAPGNIRQFDSSHVPILKNE